MSGDRLVRILSSAEGPVKIASPFIKTRALERVLDVLDEGVTVTVYTRWLPFEVAVGVSDVEVYDLVNDLVEGRVLLLRELHGKAYFRGGEGLVGSGNLTMAGMGWGRESNLEVFVESDIDEDPVANFFAELERRAYEAGSDIRDAIEKCASQIDVDEDFSSQVANLLCGSTNKMGGWIGRDSGSRPRSGAVWLPQTAEPRRLYDVHSESGMSVLASTREDAEKDLTALGVPRGLGRAEFVAYIRANLVQTAVFNLVHSTVADGGKPEEVLIEEFGISEGEAKERWQIIADWLMHFFPEKYRLEAPTESYRLVPSRTVE